MGFGKKSYEDQLDDELKDKFDQRSKDKSGGEISADVLEKPSQKKKSKASVVWPEPQYNSPVSAKIKIWIMFFALWFLLMFIAWVLILSINGYNGSTVISFNIQFLIIFTFIVILFNVIIYYMSDSMVLRSYNARIIQEKDNPRLYNIVKNIAMRAGLPMPKVAIVPMSTPNAFATGRNPEHAVVAATEGILDLLDDDELEGVIAHEIAHVKNRDILVMTVAATAAMIIAFVARIMFYQMIFGRSRDINWPMMLLAAITIPIAAILIKLAISRSREYKADRIGAIIIQKPLALAGALEKLEVGNKLRPIREGNPSTSSLFIVNPFRSGALAAIFSTHPPMKERVKRLRKMAEDFSYM
jgi:heat shock protein HtpX